MRLLSKILPLACMTLMCSAPAFSQNTNTDATTTPDAMNATQATDSTTTTQSTTTSTDGTTTTSSVKLINSDGIIENLQSALDQAKKQSQIAVLFPTKIPETTHAKLYANGESTSSNWIITVNTTADCKVKSCVIGSVSATKSAKLEKTYASGPHFDNPTLKHEVKLANNLVGYFTPGHAEADWHPAKLEWQMNDALYSLSWDEKNVNQATLVEVTDSAIQNAQQS